MRPPQRSPSDDSPTQVPRAGQHRGARHRRSRHAGPAATAAAPSPLSTFWSRPTRSTRTSRRQWFNDVSSKFEKQTGAKVTFETFASPNDELTKIQTSVLSGQGPDIYSLGTTFTPTAYSTGAFEELTADDWTKIGGKDRFLPATLGISGPDDSHQVGIPFASRPFVMAYNKDLLTAAGIDKPADSWDGLLDQAKTLTKGDTYGLAVAYGDCVRPVEVHLGDERPGR